MQDGTIDLLRILEDAAAQHPHDDDLEDGVFAKREIRMILYKAGARWSDPKLDKTLARAVDFGHLEPVRAKRKTRWGILHTENCYKVPEGGAEGLAKVLNGGDNEVPPE